MNSKHYLIPITATASLFWLLSTAFANPGMHHGLKGQAFLERHCIGWENLQQREKKEVMNLVKQYKTDLFPEMERYQALRANLKAALAQKELNEDKIKKLVRECNELRSKIFTKRIKFQVKLKNKYNIFFDLGPGMGFYHGFGHPRGQMTGEFCPSHTYN